MRPTARELAARDMAKAALMGAFDGSDFGTEPSPFGAEHDPMGYEHDGSFGEEVHGEEMHGDELHGEFSGRHRRRQPQHQPPRQAPPQAAPRYVVQHAPQQHAPQHAAPRLSEDERRALWEHRERKARTQEHRRELFPNEGSDIKLGKSSFSLTNQGSPIVCGAAGSISYAGMPDDIIQPKRVIMNAPMPGFVTITEIKVGTRSVTLGGPSDAFEYSPLAHETSLSLPTMGSSTRATVLGDYTGFYPSNMNKGNKFPFTITFQGVSKAST